MQRHHASSRRQSAGENPQLTQDAARLCCGQAQSTKLYIGISQALADSIDIAVTLTTKSLQAEPHDMITRRQAIAASLLPLASWQPASGQATAPLSDQERALHALNRLGYGPRPGDAAAIARQGAGPWLEQFLARQMEPSTLALPQALDQRLQGFATTQLSQAALIGRYREATQANQAAQRAAGPNSTDSDTAAALAKARRELVRPVLVEASSERLLRAMDSPAQLEELLVEFWFNHFNVFAGKGQVAVLVGDYERQAIRPHVFGRFRNMLSATARHPAMLIYLDNVQSVAPGYQAPGRQINPNAARLTGLNENYARELMELHTLGVDGGYSQRDVTELARMLTGWTINYRAALSGSQGDLFVFDPGRHDRGSKEWLGQKVESGGKSEGEMALDLLATHPATARHIAFKLAQAFVADQPPPTLVQRMAARFTATSGDLKAVMQTMISSDEFWRRESFGTKFKTPYRYLLSTLRALDVSDVQDIPPLMQVLAQAGMPLYGAQTPDGYKNVEAAWMNPEALAQRVQFSAKLAERRASRAASADSDTAALLGLPIFTAATRASVAQEPAQLRTALLLGSPDFMHY